MFSFLLYNDNTHNEDFKNLTDSVKYMVKNL